MGNGNAQIVKTSAFDSWLEQQTAALKQTKAQVGKKDYAGAKTSLESLAREISGKYKEPPKVVKQIDVLATALKDAKKNADPGQFEINFNIIGKMLGKLVPDGTIEAKTEEVKKTGATSPGFTSFEANTPEWFNWQRTLAGWVQSDLNKVAQAQGQKIDDKTWSNLKFNVKDLNYNLAQLMGADPDAQTLISYVQSLNGQLNNRFSSNPTPQQAAGYAKNMVSLQSVLDKMSKASVQGSQEWFAAQNSLAGRVWVGLHGVASGKDVSDETMDNLKKDASAFAQLSKISAYKQDAKFAQEIGFITTLDRQLNSYHNLKPDEAKGYEANVEHVVAFLQTEEKKSAVKPQAQAPKTVKAPKAKSAGPNAEEAQKVYKQNIGQLQYKKTLDSEPIEKWTDAYVTRKGWIKDIKQMDAGEQKLYNAVYIMMLGRSRKATTATFDLLDDIVKGQGLELTTENRLRAIWDGQTSLLAAKMKDMKVDGGKVTTRGVDWWAGNFKIIIGKVEPSEERKLPERKLTETLSQVNANISYLNRPHEDLVWKPLSKLDLQGRKMKEQQPAEAGTISFAELTKDQDFMSNYYLKNTETGKDRTTPERTEIIDWMNANFTGRRFTREQIIDAVKNFDIGNKVVPPAAPAPTSNQTQQQQKQPQEKVEKIDGSGLVNASPTSAFSSIDAALADQAIKDELAKYGNNASALAQMVKDYYKNNPDADLSSEGVLQVIETDAHLRSYTKQQ